MKKRTVEMIVAPPAPRFVGDGFRVHNFIPDVYRLDMKRMDPFLILDYNSKYNFPPSEKQRGVGVHPHRGFETVTIAYEGSVAHHDSHGGGGVIGKGDVQWMTAASGVLHKEYHTKEFSEKGGIFQMVQLWVNLPAKDKMSEPKYQPISHSQIPIHELENNQGIVEVIAGEFKGTVGTASTFTPVHLYNLKLKAGANVTVDLPAHYNTGLIAIEGNAFIHGEEVPQDYFALMSNDGESFTINTDEDVTLLLISGEPLNEPIVAHGPFVMNTHEEIMQAFTDYNRGAFGYLEDNEV